MCYVLVVFSYQSICQVCRLFFFLLFELTDLGIRLPAFQSGCHWSCSVNA